MAQVNILSKAEITSLLDMKSVVEAVEKAIQGKDCTFSAFIIAAVRAALEELESEQQ